MIKEKLVITTQIGSVKKQVVWTPSEEPLALDHHALWVVQKMQDNLVIRYIGEAEEKTIINPVIMVNDEHIQHNAEIKLRTHFGVRFRRPSKVYPPYKHTYNQSQVPTGDQFYVLYGRGKCVQTGIPAEKKFVAWIRQKPVFTLEKKGSHFILMPLLEGVRFKGPYQSAQLIPVGAALTIDDWTFYRSTVMWGHMWWKHTPFKPHKLPDHPQPGLLFGTTLGISLVLTGVVFLLLDKLFPPSVPEIPVIEPPVPIVQFVPVKPKVEPVPVLQEPEPKPVEVKPTPPKKVVEQKKVKPPEKPKPKQPEKKVPVGVKPKELPPKKPQEPPKVAQAPQKPRLPEKPAKAMPALKPEAKAPTKVLSNQPNPVAASAPHKEIPSLQPTPSAAMKKPEVALKPKPQTGEIRNEPQIKTQSPAALKAAAEAAAQKRKEQENEAQLNALKASFEGAFSGINLKPEVDAGTSLTALSKNKMTQGSNAVLTGKTSSGVRKAYQGTDKSVASFQSFGSDNYNNLANAQARSNAPAYITIGSADSKDVLIDEGLTEREVGEVIHRHQKEIRFCHESLLGKHPRLEGKLVLSFEINPAGRVTTAVLKSASGDIKLVAPCLISRLKTWQFPKPKGGVSTRATYPFFFKALDL